MESDGELVVLESRQGRKRLRCVSEWARKKRKIAKDSGKAYKTYKGERVVKKISIPLSCYCSNRCASQVNVTERDRIFHMFYDLSDHDDHNKYFYGLIERSVPKRKKSCLVQKPRKNAFTYVRLSNGDRVKVCKQVFCQTHGITKRTKKAYCLVFTLITVLARIKIPSLFVSEAGWSHKESSFV